MTNADDSDHRLDEAVAWQLRLSRDASEADWQAFAAWLEADAANRAAFDLVEDADALMNEVVADGIDTAGPPADAAFGPRSVPHARATQERPWIAAAIALAACAIVAVFVWRPSPPEIAYATRTGETRSVVLPDGTRLDVGASTHLTAQVSHDSRHVSLNDGEVIFRVARDAQHPFVVRVGDRDVRVIGTVFDLLRSAGVTTLTLAEGKVVVSGDGPDDTATLLPGEAYTHDDATNRTTIGRVNPADAMAWKNGYFVYRNVPLNRIVSDLNRYYARPIVLEGTASLRFSGVLRLDDETTVLQRIATFLPVRISSGAGGRIILRGSPTRP